MHALQSYRCARFRLFRWRCSLEWEHKLALALGFAALTGIAAQVLIFLPWTPVPLTLQTLPVLLGAVVLGKHWGGASQALYVALGVTGVPWFTGMGGGYEHLLGASGGYLLGFVAAAWMIGYITDVRVGSRGLASMVALFLCGTLVIYCIGLVGLYMWLCAHSGAPTAIELFTKGVFPFLPGDVLKAVLAAMCAYAIVPKRSFC